MQKPRRENMGLGHGGFQKQNKKICLGCGDYSYRWGIS